MHMIFNACDLLPPALSMYYYAKIHGSTLRDMGNQTGREQGEKVAGTQNNLLRLNQNIHKEANYLK